MPSLLPSLGAKESPFAFPPQRETERTPDGTEGPFAGLMAQYATPPPQDSQNPEPKEVGTPATPGSEPGSAPKAALDRPERGSPPPTSAPVAAIPLGAESATSQETGNPAIPSPEFNLAKGEVPKALPAPNLALSPAPIALAADLNPPSPAPTLSVPTLSTPSLLTPPVLVSPISAPSLLTPPVLVSSISAPSASTPSVSPSTDSMPPATTSAVALSSIPPPTLEAALTGAPAEEMPHTSISTIPAVSISRPDTRPDTKAPGKPALGAPEDVAPKGQFEIALPSAASPTSAGSITFQAQHPAGSQAQSSVTVAPQVPAAPPATGLTFHPAPGPKPALMADPQIQAQAAGPSPQAVLTGEAPIDRIPQEPLPITPQTVAVATTVAANHAVLPNAPKRSDSTRGPSLLETPRQLPVRTRENQDGNATLLPALPVAESESKPAVAVPSKEHEVASKEVMGAGILLRPMASLKMEKSAGTPTPEKQDQAPGMPATRVLEVAEAPSPHPGQGNRDPANTGQVRTKAESVRPAMASIHAPLASRPVPEGNTPPSEGTRVSGPGHEKASVNPALRTEAHASPSMPTATPTFSMPTPPGLGLQPQPGSAAAQLHPATSAAPAHPVAIQVGDSLKWILRQSNPSAELQLHPENLGKVTIQLKVEGTEVHARVWASEATTLPVLQDHRAYLEVSLRQQGLQLGSFDLQQGQRGHQPQPQMPSPPAYGAFADDKASITRQESPIAMASTFASSHRIEVLA